MSNEVLQGVTRNTQALHVMTPVSVSGLRSNQKEANQEMKPMGEPVPSSQESMAGETM